MYYIYLETLDRGNFHTKDKIDQFCQIQDKKKLLNGYFHSRTFFNSRTLPNGFDRFFNVLFERFFPLQTVRNVRNGKSHSSVLFSTPTPKIDLFWVWSSKIQYLEAPGI